MTETKNSGKVACYIRNKLCFNFKNIVSNSVEHVFFEHVSYQNQCIHVSSSGGRESSFFITDAG